MLRFCFPRRFHDRAAPLTHRALRAELPAAEAVDADAAVDRRFSLSLFYKLTAHCPRVFFCRIKRAPAKAGALLFGPSDRIRTCGIVVPNHARYQLRYTRAASEETRCVPFPPGGENCTSAPSFFLTQSNPLRWALIGGTRERGTKETRRRREGDAKKLTAFRFRLAAGGKRNDMAS